MAAPSPLAALAVWLAAGPPAAAAPIPVPVPVPRLDPDGIAVPAEAVRRLGSARLLGLVSDLAYSPDGALLVTGGTLTGRDPDTGRVRWRGPPGAWAHQFAVSADGRTIWAAAAYVEGENNRPVFRLSRVAAADGTLVGQVTVGGWAPTIYDVSPAGRVAVLRRETGDLAVLDGGTGRVVGGWAPPAGETVSAAALSPDGQTLAVAAGGWADGTTEHRDSVRVVAAGTGAVRHQFPVPRATAVRFGPAGRAVVAVTSPPAGRAGPSPTVRVWDAGTGDPIADFPTADASTPTGVAVTPDGTAVLLTGNGCDPTVYDLPAGRVRFRGPGLTGSPAALHPAGALLAAGGRNLSLWDAQTGARRPGSPPPEAGYRGGLTFSPAGDRVVGVSDPGRDVVEWDVATGRETARHPWARAQPVGLCPGATWSGGWDRPPPAARSPDGRLVARPIAARHGLAALLNGTIVLTAPGTGREVGRLPKAADSYPELAFSADGRYLAAGGHDRVAVWDVRAGGPARHLPVRRENSHGQSGPALVPCPVGRLLAVHDVNVGPDGNTPGDPGRWSVGVFDLASGAEVRRFGGPGTVRGLTWAAGGTRLAGIGVEYPPGGWVYRRFVADLTADKMPLPPAPANPHEWSLALSPDGRTLAVVGSPKVQLVEVATGEVRHTFAGADRTSNIDALAFSPDGRYLAAEAGNGPVLLWDVRGSWPRRRPPARPPSTGLGTTWRPTPAGGSRPSGCWPPTRRRPSRSSGGRRPPTRPRTRPGCRGWSSSSGPRGLPPGSGPRPS